MKLTFSAEGLVMLSEGSGNRSNHDQAYCNLGASYFMMERSDVR